MPAIDFIIVFPLTPPLTVEDGPEIGFLSQGCPWVRHLIPVRSLHFSVRPILFMGLLLLVGI